VIFEIYSLPLGPSAAAPSTDVKKKRRVPGTCDG